jgi:hypothetical protein
MFNNKSFPAKFATALLLCVSFLFSTVFFNHLSISSVGHNLEPSGLNLVVNTDLPSAVAQSIPSPIPSFSLNANAANAAAETPKKFVLEQNKVLTLLLVVLVGILSLLFTLLSPVVGLFWRPNTQDSLKEKALFLTESFPKLLEGVSIILIVMVIAVLTLAGVLESQGTISILSVLVGYVLGRKSTQLEYASAPSNRSESAIKPAAPPRKPSSSNTEDVWKV